MEVSHAITTIATIAAICEGSNKRISDYLDIITPFVLQCLPSNTGSKVDLLLIKSKMEQDFFFIDMPLGVVKTILIRIASRPNSILLMEGEPPHFEFRVKTTNLKSDFKSKCKRSKEIMEVVAKELAQYLSKEYGIEYELEAAKALLFESFSTFFASILDSEKGIIPGMTTRKDKRRVAKFILEEKRKASSVFDKIEELTKGYVIYQAIYFYEKQPSLITTVTLDNTVVYLDTPVLIDALGYRSTESTKAVKDLINLVRKLGGEVKVHSHVIVELQGILEAFCDGFPNINTFKLDGLLKKYRSKLAILTLSQSLENEIRKELEIEDAPPLGITADWETLNVEEAIRRFYQQSLNGLTASELNIGKKRVENDTRSLMAIVRARNGESPTSFNNCRAVLLSDSKTARKVYSYLRDGADGKEINLVYGVMDLSCVLWLSSTRCTNLLRQDILLYSVSAAIEASDNVIKRMLEYTAELELIGTILPETAVAMRSNPRAKQIIADLSENEASGVSKDNVIRTANKIMIEERATKKALPKMRIGKKLGYITTIILAWILFACLIVVPVFLQLSQVLAGKNPLMIVVSIVGVIVAIISLIEKNRTVKHIGTILGNYIEDSILAIELGKARKHAEYFIE